MRRILRILAPAIVVVVWLGIASSGGGLFSKIDEVSSNDPTAYLPESAEATEARALQMEFLDSESVPAVVLFASDEKLAPTEVHELNSELASAVTDVEMDGSPSPVIPSEDERAAQAFVPIDQNADVSDQVDLILQNLTSSVPSDVSVYVTGPAGFAADLSSGFGGIDGILLAVALIAVFIILLLVYRAVLLPILVLIASMFALTGALFAVWNLAKSGALLLNGQIQGILFILVIGAATDYSLLFVARYREELVAGSPKQQALLAAIRGSAKPIVASGSTVIAGLMCLLLSDLRSNSALGPVASLGIIFAMLASLTLLPALLYFFGNAAFWPRIPAPNPATKAGHESPATSKLWGKVASLVERSSRRIWIVTTVLLALGCLGITQLNAQGVAQSELLLSSSQARDGQVALAEHFPGGSGSPVYVVAPESELTQTAKIMTNTPGIGEVSVSTKDSPSSTAPVSTQGQITSTGNQVPPAPTVVDGKVLLEGTLTNAADSPAAQETVNQLRSSVADGIVIGGVTATDIDTNAAAIHDRNLIIPIVLTLILVILILLLRSITAPVILIATTVLSFGTALGVSALVFNYVFKFPGAEPAVPLYGFVFLVALGIDYNIFLMTRVREESLIHGTRPGILRGLTLTGGVITSAGVVLAATFAALAVIPILFLAQLAFIVAFGVLLDTLVVRSLLVPALAYDIGPKVWWPSVLKPDSEQEADAKQPTEVK